MVPALTTAIAALIVAHTKARLEPLRAGQPYDAFPSLGAHLRHLVLALGAVLALVRRKIRARVVDDSDGCNEAEAGADWESLVSLSGVLWRGYEAESEVRVLRFPCAQLRVRDEKQQHQPLIEAGRRGPCHLTPDSEP